MVYRHTDQQIQLYFENDALNQTAIKSLLKDGMQSFVRRFQQLIRSEDDSSLYYIEKGYLVIGGAADYYISQGEKAFNEKYFFSQLKKKPGEKEMAILHNVMDMVVGTKSEDLSSYKKEIYEACNANGYYMNRKRPNDKDIAKDFRVADDPDYWKNDTRPAAILSTGLAQVYWKELLTSVGKQILSDDQKQCIDRITSSWLNHPNTSGLFKVVDGVDVIYQMPLYFTYQGVRCKILVDMIVIDHNRKIIKDIDFKTMSDDVLKFRQAVRERRYDIQASLYMEGTKNSLDQISKLINRDVSEYKLSNFAFIVESTTSTGIPLIFPMGDIALNIGMIGKDDDYMISKGWYQGIILYKQWSDNEWKIEKRIPTGVIWVNDKLDYELNL